VVAVGVHVEQAATAGPTEGSQEGGITSFTHVDHALQHVSRGRGHPEGAAGSERTEGRNWTVEAEIRTCSSYRLKVSTD
jgi:hypothetical protein